MWTGALLLLLVPYSGEDFEDRLQERFEQSVFDQPVEERPFDEQLTALSFQEASQSEYVGGVVVNRQPREGRVSVPEFRYLIRENRVLMRFVTGEGKQWDVDSAADIVLRATKTAIDGGSVLFTATGDLYWAHPSLNNHRIVRQLAALDLYVLRYKEPIVAHSAVILENEWRVEPDQLGASREQPVFHLFVRRKSLDGRLTIVPDISETIEKEVARGLVGPDETIVRNLYDFVIIHRIVRSIADGALEDFPQQQWEEMIGELIARQKSTQNMIDESPEESFKHATEYHEIYPDVGAMQRVFDARFRLK